MSWLCAGTACPQAVGAAGLSFNLSLCSSYFVFSLLLLLCRLEYMAVLICCFPNDREWQQSEAGSLSVLSVYTGPTKV